MNLFFNHSNDKINEHLFNATRGPLPLLAVNWVARTLEKYSGSLLDMSADFVVEAAKRQTDLSDWGNKHYKAPLEILFKSCQEEANLTFWGKFLFREKIISILKNNLCIQDELKRAPQILREKINKPLFIIGLPRTGTTLLHNLIAQDINMRYIKGWESRRPSLHPKYLSRKEDPRISRGAKEIKRLFRYYPQAYHIHPMTNEGPEECHFLLAHSLVRDSTFNVLFHLPQYQKWVQIQNHENAYQHYYEILQLLQHNSKKQNWVLKSPDHMNHLNTLLKVFPDACIVIIHRDLNKVMPSCCNLIAFGRLINSRHVDFNALGKETTHMLNTWLSNAQKDREGCNPSSFYDIHYHDLLMNPVQSVQSIYNYFNFKYDIQVENRMLAWLKANHPRKQGASLYSLQQFGLKSSQINKRFKNYMVQYGILNG
ncbi:MAG: sulfotransferase [Proteobacteria bacterium]|nr:sulfotransferase [Pseudomonadota bacterium]